VKDGNWKLETGWDLVDLVDRIDGGKEAVVRLMTRKEVMAALGVGKHKLATLVDCGCLTPRHFKIDEKGRPLDRAVFRREEVEAIVGGRVEAEG
jgi:hypothetical protein